MLQNKPDALMLHLRVRLKVHVPLSMGCLILLHTPFLSCLRVQDAADYFPALCCVFFFFVSQLTETVEG